MHFWIDTKKIANCRGKAMEISLNLVKLLITTYVWTRVKSIRINRFPFTLIYWHWHNLLNYCKYVCLWCEIENTSIILYCYIILCMEPITNSTVFSFILFETYSQHSMDVYLPGWHISFRRLVFLECRQLNGLLLVFFRSLFRFE